MDTTTVSSYILDTMPLNQFIAFLIIGWFGVAAGMIHEIFNGFQTIKESGGFSIYIWFANNKWRLLMSLVCIVILIVAPSLFGYDMSAIGNKEMFLAGFFSDKLLQLTKAFKK